MLCASVLLPVCCPPPSSFFFFNDPPPPEIYSLPLHDALPIWHRLRRGPGAVGAARADCKVTRPCPELCHHAHTVRVRPPHSESMIGARRDLDQRLAVWRP